MSDQAWALVFVIVGAVLGVIGTVITTYLQNRHSHARWRRDQQKAAYLAFLREWHERFGDLWEFVYIPVVHEPPEDHLVPLYRLRWDLDVFGSEGARTLAGEAYEKLNEFWSANNETRDARCAAAEQAIEAYAIQVRKDLGTG